MTAPSFRIVPADFPDLPAGPALRPNWRVLQAVIADSFAVFELMHDNGTRAEWFFDGAGRQSSNMSVWSADTQQAFYAAFQPTVQALLDDVLSVDDTQELSAVLEFMRLGPPLRAAIVTALQPRMLPEPVHIEFGAPDAAPLPWVDPPALHRTLSANMQERFMAALRDKTLTWPSPVSDIDMRCTGSVTLDNFNSMYRFREPTQGLDVFVLATAHLSRVAGLFVPAHGVVVSQVGDQSRNFHHNFVALSHRLLQHLAAFAGNLLVGRSRSSGQTRFATFLRGGGSAHLGHQLWNELAAIDALCVELPRENLPEWLVPGIPGSEIEFYGPIDTLFPEIVGRVRRGFTDQAAVIRHAYENQQILFRATREYVSDELRRRVIAQALTNAPPLPATDPAFMIGLRVENRTATDLEGLCALIIEEAVALYPGCTIVFDGHNARGNTREDGVITSYREDAASRSPLDVERDIVIVTRTRFIGQPVQILDTLGEPLATSLAWAHACMGFIAIWGAGLAKYRWVANKPGLIVTNRWNLDHKGDLRIYDDATYMEKPSPVVFVPGDVVQDVPSAPMLIPFESPSYNNFSFDTFAMRKHVHAFLVALNESTGESG